MACPRGKATPNAQTKLMLFSASGGYCQNPNCANLLFIDTGTKNIHIAEMAHIFSAIDGGPRTAAKMSPAERGAFENIILLCSNCHTMIDKAEADFPDSLIKSWKKGHMEKLHFAFGIQSFEDRAAARMVVSKIIAENSTVFELYGPMVEGCSDPESDLPRQWERKVLLITLPNNRKLLSIADANYALLTPEERKTLERFRMHVDDFENKHVGDGQVGKERYPEAIDNIFI